MHNEKQAESMYECTSYEVTIILFLILLTLVSLSTYAVKYGESAVKEIEEDLSFRPFFESQKGRDGSGGELTFMQGEESL